jgi:hypothetical protein
VLLLGSLQWPHQTTGNGGAPCIRFGHSNRPLSCSGIIPCILLSHVVVGCYPITGSAPPASVPSSQVIHHTVEALAIFQAVSKKQSIVLHQCRVSARQSSIIRKPYQLFRLQPTLSDTPDDITRATSNVALRQYRPVATLKRFPIEDDRHAPKVRAV